MEISPILREDMMKHILEYFQHESFAEKFMIHRQIKPLIERQEKMNKIDYKEEFAPEMTSVTVDLDYVDEGIYLTASGGGDWAYTDNVDQKLYYKEFKMLSDYFANSGQLGSVPFWETTEFDESDFEIIDNTINFKKDLIVRQEAQDFFTTTLKPMVDSYLKTKTQIEYPNGDGIDAYERAMMLVK